MATSLNARRALVALAAVPLVLAACSNGSTSGPGSQGSPKSAPAASATSIGTDTATGIGTVLDTPAGLTLYINTKEEGGQIVCTGSCAQAWPPVAASGTVPASPSGVHGTFGTVTRPDGTTQLTFDGMPLYTFAGDTAPGQANGQGLSGVWYAVGPKGPITTMSTGSSSGSSSSGSGGGNGRGY